MTGEALAQKKRGLRRDLASIRKSLESDRAAAANRLRDNFITLPAFQDQVNSVGSVVAGYWSMGSEMDVRPLLDTLAHRGVPLALPVVVAPDQPLEFRMWRPGDRLQEAGFGTSVPMPDAPAADPSLLIVPLLGFDRRGHRLGYGGGFYDRTIAHLAGRPPITAGVAFAEQEIDRVPTDHFDCALDFVVTDREVVDCRGVAMGEN